ncbi:MAG TPA: ABC transporter ATP-binding protein, partial [Stellaceae bacterium]|nr:ABC transporter ATP-binding protein [Stellaceae bacterium]
ASKRATELLDRVGLADKLRSYPAQLSGGQQQRVAIARALAIRPDVFLLDEPLSNLDAKLREEMQVELRQIQRNVGITTVLVTHDQAEAMALSDRIVIMNKGRAEQIAEPDRAYEQPASPFVATFLGKTNLLEGRIAAGTLSIGGRSWPVPPGIDSGAVTVTLRPEKIGFTDDGLAGIVRTRLFLGSQWLFQIDTGAGLILVVRQNGGDPMPQEGAEVALTWRADDMRVAPAAVLGA